MTQPPPATAYPGLFISFEGGDGVGKTTQIRRLSELLTEAGVEHICTREPGGTELGAEIRRLLLHGGHVAPRAEALLYAADRAHHIATRVRPALQRGAVVLADRYLDSSVAYQGAARCLGPAEVRELSLWATEGLLPDLTILLDADPGLAERRATDRGAKDRLEQEGHAFRVALREQFRTLADAEPERFVVVAADQPVEQVAHEVNAAVVRVLRVVTKALRSQGAYPQPGGLPPAVLCGLETFLQMAACRAGGQYGLQPSRPEAQA